MKLHASKIVWLIVVVAIAAFLVYGFMPKPVDVETVFPNVGSLAITVDDDGETRIREKYVISAPVTGKMLRVERHAGDPVLAGKTSIANIQPSDPSLLDARNKAEALARVRVAVAAHHQASITVQRATEALQLAEQNHSRSKKLIKSKATSRASFDATENRLRLAIADVRSAESARRVAQYEIDQAEAAVKFIKSNFDPSDDNFFDLVSPITGKLLKIYREDSGVITSGSPIACIGDPADLELVIDVLSTDAVKVKPGDAVRVEHWGGETPLAAKVRLVEPSAFLKVSALGVEEKRVNVIADFVDPLENRKSLGDGYRIEAKIVVEETPSDSLTVPTGVLFRNGDKWHAFRVVAGMAERADLLVGRSNGVMTEIRSGITKEDRLILHPTEEITTGRKVRLR